MSFLASDIITSRVKAIVGSSLAAQFDSDATQTAALLKFLSDAVRYLYSKRPDCAMDSEVYVEFAAVTALDQSIPLDEKWIPFLHDTVLGRAFQMDGDNEGHRARAAEHFVLAREEMNV